MHLSLSYKVKWTLSCMGGEFKYCIISLTTFEVGSSAYNTLKESMKKIAKITKVLCTPVLSQWSQILFELASLHF